MQKKLRKNAKVFIGLPTISLAGFCIFDGWRMLDPPPNAAISAVYDGVSCKLEGIQGISVGWVDTYPAMQDGAPLAGQTIDITNLPPGIYWLESIVDPSNRIKETNEDNNVAHILLDLTA